MRSLDDAQLQINSLADDERLKNSSWLTDFVPRRFLGQGDLQTLFANFLPRKVHLPVPESLIVEVEAETHSRVLCHCNWQPAAIRRDRPTMLLVHGLEGSSQSQYMLGNAARAWRAGWNVVRMNMRNCGGTELLAPTLYHSGLSADVAAVSRCFAEQHGLTEFAWVGYSMGGNLVLKAAGEYGGNAPEYLRAVAAVSPVVDLAASSDALHLKRNLVYEWNFLKNMLSRYRRKAKLFPGRFSTAHHARIRSLRSYDEYIVAPNAGFAGADDYYARAAAATVIDRIRIPTLILHALDDPFIRLTSGTRAKVLANPAITLVETAHGGHCGFLAPALDGEDGYWAEQTLFAFFQFCIPDGTRELIAANGEAH